MMIAEKSGGIESIGLLLNSSVLRWAGTLSDGTALSVDGRVFQARATATENVPSPSVDQQVDVMTRVGVAADRT